MRDANGLRLAKREEKEAEGLGCGVCGIEEEISGGGDESDEGLRLSDKWKRIGKNDRQRQCRCSRQMQCKDCWPAASRTSRVFYPSDLVRTGG